MIIIIKTPLRIFGRRIFQRFFSLLKNPGKNLGSFFLFSEKKSWTERYSDFGKEYDDSKKGEERSEKIFFLYSLNGVSQIHNTHSPK